MSVRHFCEAISLTTKARCKNSITSGCTLEWNGVVYYICRPHFITVGQKIQANKGNNNAHFINLITKKENDMTINPDLTIGDTGVDAAGLTIIDYTQEFTMDHTKFDMLTMIAHEKCHLCTGGVLIQGFINNVPQIIGVCTRCNGKGLNWIASVGQRDYLTKLYRADHMSELEFDHLMTQAMLRGGFDVLRNAIDHVLTRAGIHPEQAKAKVEAIKMERAPKLGTKAISCGNCKKMHATVDDVRSCYSGTKVESNSKPEVHGYTCGACGEKHDTVAKVKACHNK